VPERVRTVASAKLALSTWPWPRKMRDWRVSDVGAWLRAIGLTRYVPVFEEAGVDGDGLLVMDAKDLRNTMCMFDVAHLSIALHAREELRVADIEGDVGRGLKDANVVVLTGSNAGRFGPAAKLLASLLKEDFVIPKAAVIFTATANGFSRRVELAVRSGFPVDAIDADGNSLIHIATKHGHRVLVQMLLNNGADVNATNKEGARARARTRATPAELPPYRPPPLTPLSREHATPLCARPYPQAPRGPRANDRDVPSAAGGGPDNPKQGEQGARRGRRRRVSC
jgi:hypothetical protein